MPFIYGYKSSILCLKKNHILKIVFSKQISVFLKHIEVVLYSSWLAVFTYSISKNEVGIKINNVVAINPRILTSMIIFLLKMYFFSSQIYYL